MRTLDSIAIECGTDKSSNGHSYCQYYDMIFDPIRFKQNNLLEIGIDKGDSLRMWREYMPHSMIHGIDIRGDYGYLEELGGVYTHIVDQSNKGELIVFASQFPDGHFNIIVDDAGHESENQIISFETLFPYLKSGGFYCIEDTLCAYDKDRWGKEANVYDRIRQMVGEVSMNGKMSNFHICSNKKIEATKYEQLNYFEANIEWFFCSAGLTIIKKI